MSSHLVFRSLLNWRHASRYLKRAAKCRPKYKELEGKGSVQEQADEACDYAPSWSSSSLADDAFTGQLRSTLQCPARGAQSHRFDNFQDLSLPLPQESGPAGCTLKVKCDCSHACSEPGTAVGDPRRLSLCMGRGSDAERNSMHTHVSDMFFTSMSRKLQRLLPFLGVLHSIAWLLAGCLLTLLILCNITISKLHCNDG